MGIRGSTGSPVSRPALRYYGSKWKLARWIIDYFPEHDAYVEPFSGAAAVLLQKPRSPIEVYNDRDGQVVNFFRVLRESPDELIRLLELTPYARLEWELAHEIDELEPLEAARRLYVRAFMNIAGPTAQWRSGWRRQKVLTRQDGKRKMTAAPITFMDVAYLYDVANRLRGVQIENDEALAVIERYDEKGTVFYCDPPYPASTRSRWATAGYRYEMTDEEHIELARLLHGVEGMVLISGYRCELYDRLYGDWERREITARVNGPGSATECLWLSPRVGRNSLPLLWGVGNLV